MLSIFTILCHAGISSFNTSQWKTDSQAEMSISSTLQLHLPLTTHQLLTSSIAPSPWQTQLFWGPPMINQNSEKCCFQAATILSPKHNSDGTFSMYVCISICFKHFHSHPLLLNQLLPCQLWWPPIAVAPTRTQNTNAPTFSLKALYPSIY